MTPARSGLRLGALAASIVWAAPACADRWFGSVSASCDSFAECFSTFELPDKPADSAFIYLMRAGGANAPLRMRIHVNKPVEGGVPIRFEIGETTFDLAPATDVTTRHENYNGKDLVAGYWIAEPRVAEIVAAMRKVDVGRLTIPVAGTPHALTVMLDGLDVALRFFDERQGRAGAQDALIERGARAAADAAVPKPLPAKDAWPKEILRIFKQNKCQDSLATFDDLTRGYIATPAPGRALWQIACAGGNYNILFILVEVRNGDMKTAHALSFPTRLHKRPNSVAVNPWWWDARRELAAFEHGRGAGDCGTLTRYRWTANGFALIDERRKEDCDGKYDDPWTKWPATKSGRRSGKR